MKNGILALTYAQLKSSADVVYHSLAVVGCIKIDIIASLCHPSVESVVSMLARLRVHECLLVAWMLSIVETC